MADDLDAILRDDRLARLGEFAIAAALDRKIDNDEPARIAPTISAVISFGAGPPGSAPW